MPVTDTIARDEILGLLNTAWLADADSLAIPMAFPDVPFTRPADGTAWAQVFVSKVAGFQATLGSALGQKRWRTVGSVRVSIRTPQGDGFVLSDKLSRVARDAFRGKRTAGGVVFSQVSIREEGPDGTYTLVDVIADFQYDTVA